MQLMWLRQVRERERVGEHGLCGARAKDEAFEQRIRSQAVGAVDAGAGSFASRIESAQTGAPTEIGADAAHEVVRRRADGNEIALKIEPVLAQEMR